MITGDIKNIVVSLVTDISAFTMDGKTQKDKIRGSLVGDAIGDDAIPRHYQEGPEEAARCNFTCS